MARKVIAIEWPDSLGPEWINEDTLLRCLAWCGSGEDRIGFKVEEVTPPDRLLKAAKDFRLISCQMDLALEYGEEDHERPPHEEFRESAIELQGAISEMEKQSEHESQKTGLL